VRHDNLSRLPDYVQMVSTATGVPLPINMPIVGRDAFRTATGVHASAVIKAQKKGDVWLADRVYSGVPAAWIGRTQEIEVGPMSGTSNVVCYLSTRGLPSTPEIVKAILDLAKRSSRVLAESEILEVLRAMSA
jgi:2-isopropylmalate synthase